MMRYPAIDSLSRSMRLLYTILWLSVICISSVIPIGDENLYNLLDLGHVAVYVVQTILWAWLFDFKPKFIAASVASSPLTELLQLLIPWRNPCFTDIYNNLIGVALGVIVVFAVKGTRGSRVSL
jgi:VanZ family protein